MPRPPQDPKSKLQKTRSTKVAINGSYLLTAVQPLEAYCKINLSCQWHCHWQLMQSPLTRCQAGNSMRRHHCPLQDHTLKQKMGHDRLPMFDQVAQGL